MNEKHEVIRGITGQSFRVDRRRFLSVAPMGAFSMGISIALSVKESYGKTISAKLSVLTATDQPVGTLQSGIGFNWNDSFGVNDEGLRPIRT